MRMRILLSLFVTVCTVSGLWAADNSSYYAAWDAFSTNNRTEARRLFQEAAKAEATKADACLSLSLLDWTEGKLESAFSHLQKFYHSSRDAGDAYLYGLYSMPFSFAGADVLTKEKLSFLESIVNKPMNGTLRAMIHESLGTHYQALRRFDKSKEHFAAVGALLDWQILGAFDNVSGSGFDKSWGAVEKSGMSDQFVNEQGAVIHWYAPGRNKPDGWFDFEYYFPTEEIIAYAQTYLDAPNAQEVYLRIGTSGSLKVWLNDALVAAVPEERNCDMDIYSYKVKLNAGSNRILLQLGQSEISRLNFMLRVTDAAGEPIPAFTAKADYSSYQKADSNKPQYQLPFFAESYLQQRMDTDADNPLHGLVLAQTYLRNDKAEEAIGLLRDMEKQYPKFSLLHYLLGEAYSRARNQTFSTRAIEAMKQVDPDAYFSIDVKCDEAISSNKLNDVKGYNEQVKGLYGENQLTRQLDSWIASTQNDKEKNMVLARENYKKYPHVYGYMNSLYRIEKEVLKNNKAATALVESYCAKYFHPAALDLLANIYLKEGKAKQGMQLLRDRIEKMPYATGYLRAYAQMLYEMQQYKEALEATDRMLALTPASASVYSLRGDIYKAMKKEKQAIESYKKSVYYDPAQFDVRTQINQLEGRKEAYELLPRYSLDSLLAISPVQADFPDDNSVIVLYHTKLIFYPEGSTEYHVELAVKILNKTGVEIWKEYNIPYYNRQRLFLDKAEIIKENGQKVKAENRGGHVVFTNLEEGNTFYLEYRVRDYSQDKLSRHFFDQQIFNFAMPGMVMAYSIFAPADRPFNHVVSNGEVPMQETTYGDMKLYHWALLNQPAIRMEPYMGSLLDVSPTLSFSSISEWQVIGNWYRDLTANKFKDDYLLTETVDEILKDHQHAGELEKARLFYEYIIKNITYNNVSFMQNNFIPQKASRTLSIRLGDCKDVSTLFVAMCRKVGIEANLVLLLSRDNGANLLPLPANGFNHCIAQLKVDGKTYFLELTDNKLPFGAALEVDLHSPILPIPYGRDEEPQTDIQAMDMTFRPLNSTKRTSTLRFSGNDLLTETASVRRASSASGFRHAYSGLGSEDRLKQMTQAVSAGYTNPVKVTHLEFDDLNIPADTLVYTYHLETKNVVQDVAGMKLFKIRWADSIRDMEELSLEERKYGFVLWMYLVEDETEEIFTVHLPEGKTLLETPKDIHLECANATYSLTFECKPGLVKAHRKLARKTDYVSLEEYAAFRAFIMAVGEGDNKQYLIK